VIATSGTVREAVDDLVHRYADAVCHRDEQRWAACWADDARWLLGPGREVHGRDAIAQLWRQAIAGFDAVVQNVYNGTVRAVGGTADGRWYIGEHFRRANGEAGLLLAYYDDTYRLVDQRWLFSSRQLVVLYQGPPDLSAPFHAPTA